jgi:DNA-binding CsgD family transcriptional regulator
MRRGDCALLKWSSVDMKSGFITVKTSKTGETVDIPILPMLMEELRRTQKTDSEYVFPVAAKMYRENPDNLNVRLRAILAQSGFVDAEIMQKIESVKHEPPRPLLPPDETRRNGLAAIDKAKMTESKRARMREIFRQYMDGQTVPQIAEKMGISKGIVSMHLNEVAGMVGAEVIRRPIPPVMPHKIRGNIHKKTDGPRLRRANVKGWHSFRTTWITLALSAGLPMELVRRVSGHTTADVVLKHYFRPGREQFRQALQAAMPKLLMNGAKSRDEQLREIITGITSQTWKENKKRALELLGS